MKKKILAIILAGIFACSGCQSTPKEPENSKQEEVKDNDENKEDVDDEKVEGGNGSEQDVAPTATPEPTKEPTKEPNAAPTPTAKPTATPTPTAKPTATPTPTAKPTATPTPTVKPTATPTPTAKPTATPTPTVKPTATPTVKPTATPTPTVKPTPTPTPTPVHVHEWKEVTKIVTHEEQGHWEEVIVKEAWVETTGGSWRTICNGCKCDMTDMSEDEATLHSILCQASYTNKWIETTIEHPAITEKQWIIDQKAYEETVVTGYKCDCGETK